MAELVLPLPLLPAASLTPLLASVIRLLAAVMPLVGVKVAVQVIPPSLLLTALSVPLETVRSLLVKPLTASLKVMVTVAVSPAFSALSFSVMVAVGNAVSMA